MAGQRKKAGPEKGSVVETRNFTYLPAGVGVDPYEGNEPLLDPELEKARETEAAKLAEVPTGVSREDITIAPELVKARDAEIKRLAGGDSPAKADEAPAKKAPAKSKK